MSARYAACICKLSAGVLFLSVVTSETRLALRLLIDKRQRERIAVSHGSGPCDAAGEARLPMWGGGGFLKRGRFLPGHDMGTTRVEISATAVEHLGPVWVRPINACFA
jgi:hypothetical protein